MSLSAQLLIILALIIASAFFSISEISLAAARRLKLTVLAEEGHQQALRVLALQEKPGHFFTAIQIGLNTVAILAGIVGESALTPYYSQLIHLSYQGSWLEPLAAVCSFLTITSLFVILADLVPKRIAMTAPEQIALRVVNLPPQCLGRVLCFERNISVRHVAYSV